MSNLIAINPYVNYLSSDFLKNLLLSILREAEMLNRKYQVLLSKWMEDYLKLVVERYDLTFSSEIRIHMCLGILYVTSILYPEFKTNLVENEFLELSKKAGKKELREEEVHQMVSKVLFEARKAVEYRLSKEGK
jgi:hypothetical protein